MSASDGLRYSVSDAQEPLAVDMFAEQQSIEKSHQSYGANLPGASFKFAVLDTHGNRVPAQSRYRCPYCLLNPRARCSLSDFDIPLAVPQMAQTAYRAVQTPYSFFGLGRTNNYIEVSLDTDNAIPFSPHSHTVYFAEIVYRNHEPRAIPHYGAGRRDPQLTHCHQPATPTPPQRVVRGRARISRVAQDVVLATREMDPVGRRDVGPRRALASMRDLCFAFK